MADQRKHVRLASTKLGDDATFSRYVKTGIGRTHGVKRNLRLPGLELPAVVEGRTFFRKSVKRPDEMTNLLVSGHSNVKIGRDVRQGKLRGYWIYTLSLEERKTCPRSCHHWQGCYGNGMPYAKRVDHTAPDFLPRLEAEIEALCSPSTDGRGPKVLRKGVLIRLHALGDFYSEAYVDFWRVMLDRHPNLAIFGYTAWAPTHQIGRDVGNLNWAFAGRSMIRFSNGGLEHSSTVPIVNAEDCPPGAFVCPEQTGQFDACGKCGACWSTLKNVAFMAH